MTADFFFSVKWLLDFISGCIQVFFHCNQHGLESRKEYQIEILVENLLDSIQRKDMIGTIQSVSKECFLLFTFYVKSILDILGALKVLFL